MKCAKHVHPTDAARITADKIHPVPMTDSKSACLMYVVRIDGEEDVRLVHAVWITRDAS